jgi:hypothetical protein
MLCAVFSRPQELPEYIILWSQLGKNQEGETTIMATKKKAKKKAAKKAGKKSAKKR